MSNLSGQVVGLIPAAGSASRLSPIPCSKEIYPVGLREEALSGKVIPKVVSSYLLENFKNAGADQVYFILRPGKEDILNYFQEGYFKEQSIGYLVTRIMHGVPFTVDQAYRFVKEKTILFGFPDIIINDDQVFTKLTHEFSQTNDCDVMLGLFKVENTAKWDMVKVDEFGSVNEIIIKPQTTDLTYSWAIACWNNSFTEFLHQYCEKELHKIQNTSGFGNSDYHLGNCLIAAIEAGLNLKGLKFDDAQCIDIGTPGDLQKVMESNICGTNK